MFQMSTTLAPRVVHVDIPLHLTNPLTHSQLPVSAPGHSLSTSVLVLALPSFFSFRITCLDTAVFLFPPHTIPHSEQGPISTLL